MLKKWRSVLEGFMHIPGVDEHVEKLTALINYILDISWPVKKISTKKNYSPYVTEALKVKIKIKEKMYAWAKKTGSEAKMEAYKKYNNQLGKEIDRASKISDGGENKRDACIGSLSVLEVAYFGKPS